MLNSNTILNVTKVLGVFALIITIVGTLLNGLIFYVCLRKKLRKVNAFKFFAMISITDIIALYEFNLKHFIVPFYGIDYNYISLTWCRISIFIQYVSLQYSAWLLVS